VGLFIYVLLFFWSWIASLILLDYRLLSI
jgi:hypothetical protein